MDLRPTQLPDGNRSYLTSNHSIRPFSYRIIRPSSLFDEETIDLVLSSRERLLSWLEVLRGAMSGSKSGTYFVFQRDNHDQDLGSPTDPGDGKGLLANAFIEDIVGRVDVAPFINDSDCLSILDRRFWILDKRLDRLSPTVPPSTVSSKVSGTDTPYTSYTGPGGVVRPVLPDRIDISLDVSDRFRPLRYTWLAYRTHRVYGTLPGIERFDEELESRLEKRLQVLLLTETEGELE
jgi:hypothetical protein